MKHPLCIAAGIDPGLRPAAVAGHTRSCLVCQAEEARDKRVIRALGRLRHVPENAPAHIAVAVERRIAESASAKGREFGFIAPWMATAGALAATAVGTVCVVVLRRGHVAV